MRTYYFIRVNGSKIYIDIQRLIKDGEVAPDRSTAGDSEQCDDCGTDIFESAEPLGRAGLRVRCTNCGLNFVVEEEEVRAHR